MSASLPVSLDSATTTRDDLETYRAVHVHASAGFATADEDERAVWWERSTTTDTAPITDDIDHPALARAFPNMSGANIRDAALAAAFLAATEDSSAITFDHLVRAARAEYRSMCHMVVDTHRRSL